MDIFIIANHQVKVTADVHVTLPETGFLWIDTTHDEVAADLSGWRDRIESITGTHIYDPHLSDATNLAHPSYFDSTQDYAMVVFRKLSLHATASGEPLAPSLPLPQPISKVEARRNVPDALARLSTHPVTFLLLDRVLVTVHASGSRTIDAARQRLQDYRTRPEGNGYRLPASPEDLLLRLLNAMVDQYLGLRQPLTAQFDRWQRSLLDPRRPFRDWTALLDARIELRRLDNLCEEQRDALQELRDYLIDNNSSGSRSGDLTLVRINDVMEHVARVLNHTRRLESSLESAVQIHFSAMANRTNEVVRTLTVITALFMPLTLITGIFGMNFDVMPLINNRLGFWLTMGGMACIVVALLLLFRRRKYLEHRALSSGR
jgi:magnesium transporter